MSATTEAIQLYRPDPIEPLRYSAEELQIITDMYCKGASQHEINVLVHASQRLGLDLISRQMYGIMRWNADLGRKVLTIQVGIEGFRSQADRTGLWMGCSEPLWLNEKGEWLDFWLLKKWGLPVACKILVSRRGWEDRAAIAYWDEYAQLTKDRSLTSMWAGKPLTMLSKCAEALGLRKTFPTHIGSVHAPEELEWEVDQPIDGEVTLAAPVKGPSAPPAPEPAGRAAEPTRRTRTKKDAPKEEPVKEPASTPSQARSQTATPPGPKQSPEHKAAVDRIYEVWQKYDARYDQDNLDLEETARAVRNRLIAIREFDESLVPPIAEGQELRGWLAPLTPGVIDAVRQAYIADAEEEIRVRDMEANAEEAAEFEAGDDQNLFQGEEDLGS